MKYLFTCFLFLSCLWVKAQVFGRFTDPIAPIITNSADAGVQIMTGNYTEMRGTTLLPANKELSTMKVGMMIGGEMSLFEGLIDIDNRRYRILD